MKIITPLLALGITWLGLEGSALCQGIITLDTTPHPINITANGISTWKSEGVRVFVANGNVKIIQGKVQINTDSAVAWFHETEAGQRPEARVDLYCEGKIVLLQDQQRDKYQELFIRLETTAGLIVNPYTGTVQTFEEEQGIPIHYKLKKLKELGKGEYASRESTELEVAVPPGAEEDVVDIVADDIDSWMEDNTRIVVALGDVAVRRGATTFEADNAILWFQEREEEGKKRQVFKEIYAQGNVTLKSQSDVIMAEKVFKNFRDKKAIYISPRVKTFAAIGKGPPTQVYHGGVEAKEISSDKLIIKNGYFTNCNYGHPHFHIRGAKVTMTRRQTPQESWVDVVSKNNWFYYGNKRIGYLPTYTYTTKRKPSFYRGVSPGRHTRFGPFIRTDWNPLALWSLGTDIMEWSDLNVSLDYLSKRGPAGGIDYEYTIAGMKGFLQTYYLHDKSDKDFNATRAKVTDTNRGRVLWRHRYNVSKYWRADAELSFLSDRGFLREFYEPELKQGKAQETDLYLRRLEDNRSITFLLKKQIHSFDTGPEALPQIGYRLISEPLWEDRLNFTSESEIGYLDFKIDDELNVRDPERFRRLKGTTGNSAKLDSNNTISWPFKLGVFKLNPFVGGRLTAYSKSIEDNRPNEGPPAGRFAGKLGIDASTNFWRVYSLESKLFNIHGLRHIVTPEFRWEVGPIVTNNPSNLLQHNVEDGLQTYNTVVLGLRNRIQTRRGPPWQMKTVDLLDFDIEAHLFSDTKETPRGLVDRAMGNAEGFLIARRDSFIQHGFRAQITDRLALISERNEFNLNDFRFDILTWGLNYKRTESWSHFVGHRFLKDISSTLILGSTVLVGKKWSISFSEQYDLASRPPGAGVAGVAKNLKSFFSLARHSHDWISYFSLSVDGVNRNTAFGFGITPIGIGRPVGRGYSTF